MSEDTKAEATEEFVKPVPQEVAGPVSRLVGDEAVESARFEVTPEVYTDEVPAQVTGEATPPSATVPVHETFVQLDKVITDLSDPASVQIPDAGRGSTDLPIHAVASGETPEAAFAREAPPVE